MGTSRLIYLLEQNILKLLSTDAITKALVVKKLLDQLVSDLFRLSFFQIITESTVNLKLFPLPLLTSENELLTFLRKYMTGTVDLFSYSHVYRLVLYLKFQAIVE